MGIYHSKLKEEEKNVLNKDLTDKYEVMLYFD